MTDNISLVQRLAKATAEVGGKLKADKRNSEQGYNYVSADKILAACGQALADNGIAVIPSIVKQQVNIIDRGNGKSRYDATVDLVLKVTDGTTAFEEPWYGMGSDYSVPDKALYKAITSGHKYFLSKLFCIGEGNEDGEHENGEGEQKPAPAPAKQAAPAKPAQPPAPKPAAQDEPPAMTLEDAQAITNRDGVKYGDIDNNTLGFMSNELAKSLKGQTMSAEERATRERKLTAIKVIQAHRAQQ